MGVGCQRGREVERNLQIWSSSTSFPALSPGMCSPHFGHSVAPSLHAGTLSKWWEWSGRQGCGCTSRTAHSGEPAGPLCLGAPGPGLLPGKKVTAVWKSLPAAHTRGIQVWLLLGPHSPASTTLHVVCPNAEPTVQRVVPMAGGFLGTKELRLWGQKPEPPATARLCACHQFA